MAELLDFVVWESFAREVVSNICTNMLVSHLEGNLETNMVHKICKGNLEIKHNAKQN